MNIKKTIIRTLVSLKGRVLDIRATRYHRNNDHKRVNQDKVRVGFIVHETETWDKCRPVFEEMTRRDDFETAIIVCPSGNTIGDEKEYGYEWKYFSHRYNCALKALDDTGKTIDLKQMKFDYLFYQDPYITHYPSDIYPEKTSAYAKLCYIPYGLTLLKQFSDILTVYRRFFGNIYFGFMDVEYGAALLRRTYTVNCKKGLQHFISVGYPALAEFMNYPQEYDIHKIVWTPRWTFDSSLARSHFLDYKDQMITLPGKYGCSLTFRPHPLMYSTLISSELMSEQEVNDYQTKLDDLGIRTDLHSPIGEVFINNGILITDFSSIIIQFFLTGRPVIYCTCGLEMNEVFKTIIPGIYVAETWDQIESYVKEILSGNDYLAPVRKKIIESDTFRRHLDSAATITQIIKDDWMKSE